MSPRHLYDDSNLPEIVQENIDIVEILTEVRHFIGRKSRFCYRLLQLSPATVALASSICGVVPRLSPRDLEKNLDLTRNLILFMVGFAVWEMIRFQMDDQGRLCPAQFYGGCR